MTDYPPLLCLDTTERHHWHYWYGHGDVIYRCSGEPVDDDRPWAAVPRQWPQQDDQVLEQWPTAAAATVHVHHVAKTQSGQVMREWDEVQPA